MRLLGLLIAIGLALGLTMFVIDKVNEPGPSAAEQAGLDVGSNPAGMADAAKTAACDAERQAINVAEAAYRTLFGRYADVPTLLQRGNLVAAPEQYRIESTDGFVTYRLVGQNGCT